MPKTTSKGRAKQSELPDTLRKSSDKAQRTFAKAHDSAVKTYGEGEHAHRVAYAALKHSFEKVGDHWEEKETRGPSDERARSGGPNARGKTAEGVDTSATKDHLLSVARRLPLPCRRVTSGGYFGETASRKLPSPWFSQEISPCWNLLIQPPDAVCGPPLVCASSDIG
ncbi:ChaB protein,Rho termination factor [Mycobacteroides abscessus subsp. abscessus]|nr:ChaB protein,Rho termination factor [Mycobacteroides abscessus subsp. abscessus]